MNDLEQQLQSFITMPPSAIDLGLERIERLLAALGNPNLCLPPVIHVAGTNGKGSTVAFMRAMLEAAGLRVHVFTSPHLIRFNERIRLAGELADDETLIQTFADIAAVNDGAPITYFEMTTVAAFVLFAHVPADVVLLEVGLGGRLDATNVITPAVSVITRISYDHTHLLGDTLEKIATEKAGIMKPGVPCVMAYQADETVKSTLRARAAEVGCDLIEYGKDFGTEECSDGFIYFPPPPNLLPQGEGELLYASLNVSDGGGYSAPALLGAHQILNAANAITAIKIFSSLPISPFHHLLDLHIRTGLRTVEWPGRLQRITMGPIAAMLPEGAELWYDGAHNDSGAEALAEQCRRWKAAGCEIYLILGMLRNKDPTVFIRPFATIGIATLCCVPIGTAAFTPDELLTAILDGASFLSGEINTLSAVSLVDAIGSLKIIDAKAIVLVCGSLYLAEQILI